MVSFAIFFFKDIFISLCFSKSKGNWKADQFSKKKNMLNTLIMVCILVVSPHTLTVLYDSVSFNQQTVHVIGISDKLVNACLNQDSPNYSIQLPPFIISSIILIRQRYAMGSCVLLAQTTTNLCRKKLNQEVNYFMIAHSQQSWASFWRKYQIIGFRPCQTHAIPFANGCVR